MSATAVRVGSGQDHDGRLIFADEVLVAVLVRLSALHADLAGRWFLEAGFGPLSGPEHPTFLDLPAAEGWIQRRVAARGPIGAH